MAVCSHLEAFLLTSQARVVLSYKAFGSEVSLENLPLKLPEIQFWTTRVNPNSSLSLHPFSSAMTRNKLGMLEPDMDEPELEPEFVDVVLVPGLVFDCFGTRLGYGAGFYDQLLPKLGKNVISIGITRDVLLLENALPKDKHDVLMTHLVTESGIKPVVNGSW